MTTMEKFKASSDNVMVNGETVLSFINAVPNLSESRKQILSKYGINDPQPGEWYSQQQWLNAFKEIFDTLGPINIRLIGKVIAKNAKFPQITSVSEAFENINKAYEMNHKGGDIGYYKLIEFNGIKRKIIIETNIPYPIDFDCGIFLGLFEMYNLKTVHYQEYSYKKLPSGNIEYTLIWQDL